MSDVSISKIYQFLSKNPNWMKSADLNGDDITTKFETFSYLNENIDWQPGDNKKDIIYEFWKSIDNETTGKVKSGSKINNKNALSDKEMADFERNAQICERIDKFMEGVQVPSTKIKDVKGWREAVKSSMVEKAFAYLQSSKSSDISDTQIQQFYESSMKKATIEYVTATVIEEVIGKVEGYAVADDNTLSGLIGQLQKAVENDSTSSIDSLISKLEQLVKAYADTANTNSATSTDALKEYGYDPEGSLNDLQKAKIENKMFNDITGHFSSNSDYTEFKDVVDSAIKTYISSYLSDKKASEFVTLYNFNINEFIKTQAYQDLLKVISDAKEAKTAAELAAKAEESKAAFGTLGSGMQNEIDENWRSYTSGIQAELHTEFGIDTNGNIVFEQKETGNAYNQLKQKLRTKLSTQFPEAFSKIQDSFDKLVQAAWITTYNKYPSSQKNTTNSFFKEVLNQLKNIMDKLSTHPEYLAVYTGHTAYANGNLTDLLYYYGKNNTYGDDAIWSYGGSCMVNSDGDIEWDSADDSKEYGETMSDLLNNILHTSPYKGLDKTLVTSVFRQAQQDAINACKNNVKDCPYGTTSKTDGTYTKSASFFDTIGYTLSIPFAGRNDIAEATGAKHDADPNAHTSIAATGGRDWAGTSREGDRNRITVQTLVELTLYYFDKLLYQALAS